MEPYKIYKNCISKKSSNLFFKFFINLTSSYEKDFCKNTKFSGWSDINFNKRLIELRKNKKNVFSAIYNSILKSNSLQRILFENKLHKIASDFLKIDESKLTIKSITFRMDPPNDIKNSYGWHQDSAYDKFNFDSKNGAILWMPLVNTTRKNGTIVIKVGSENSNYNCSKLVKKGTKYKSKQIIIDKKYLKKYRSKHVCVNKNNALATFSGIFHKSGINASDKFRFCIIVRYGNLFAKDFIFRRNLNQKHLQSSV